MAVNLPLVDKAMLDAGSVEADEGVFGRKWNPTLVHRVTVAQAANGRQSTSKQKNRAEVKHSTRKHFRQKGTGRARAGMTSSPVRKGGGRAFPSTPQHNFRRELNRKEFRAGMATVLSQLAREGRLFVAEELVRDGPRTKPCAAMLTAMVEPGTVLFVDTEFDANFALAVRNLPDVRTTKVSTLLATELMRHERTVMSQRALEHITTIWAGS